MTFPGRDDYERAQDDAENTAAGAILRPMMALREARLRELETLEELHLSLDRQADELATDADDT
jgi:hypothetical protein